MNTTDRPLLGILCINLSLIFAACNSALIRYLTIDNSPVQISFVRLFVKGTFVGAAILVLRRPQLFVSKRYHLFVTRRLGLLSGVATVTFYLSLANLDLADAFTVSMSGPIFVAMLSGWLLGERVPLVRWLAIGVGLFGVVVVMRPGAGLFNIWAVMALVSAVGYALGMMLNRKLTETEDSNTIIFYVGIISGALLLMALPFDWQSPTLQDAPLLLVLGLLEFIIMYFIVQAYRYAAANTVISFDYISVFYVIIAGFIVFAEVPNWNLLAGVALLVISGLTIVVDEARRKEPQEPESDA